MGIPQRWQWKWNRWREQFTRMVGSEPRAARPRLCPSCGTLVGITAGRCHECGTSMTFSLAATTRALATLLPERAPATQVILFVNGLLFVLSLILTARLGQGFSLTGGISGEVLLRLGGRFTPLLLEGELWRLVVPIFLHGGLFHIGCNTLVLMDVGPQLEEIYGSARYLFLYVATGVVSFLASTFSSLYLWGALGGISIGASGSLMGLIGLMLAITSRRGGLLMQMYRKQLLRWIVYIFVFGFLIGGIDNAAHLGGLAAGFVFGRFFDDREPSSAPERSRAYRLGWLAALVVLGSFAAMLLRFFGTGQT